MLQIHTELNFSRLMHMLEHGCANHDSEGKRFKSPIHCCDSTKPPYLFTGELCTSPCTVNSCLCTSYAVGAPASASLCSEHVTQTSYCSRGHKQWEKLRHRAVVQCVTLAHPWFRDCIITLHSKVFIAQARGRQFQSV